MCEDVRTSAGSICALCSVTRRSQRATVVMESRYASHEIQPAGHGARESETRVKSIAREADGK